MTGALPTRRSVVQQWIAATSLGVGAAEFMFEGEAQAQLLSATPSCGPADAPTIAQTEGPYYTPRTPQKANFRPDAQGDGFTLMGFVVDRRCRPIASALVDLWHADARGAYDNQGFRLRGHQLTDTQGRFVFETIIPGAYPGRTRHYHVKAQAPGQRALTTQLYFPNEPGNQRDSIFDRRLLMRVDSVADGKVGRYDFVLNT